MHRTIVLLDADGCTLQGVNEGRSSTTGGFKSEIDHIKGCNKFVYDTLEQLKQNSTQPVIVAPGTRRYSPLLDLINAIRNKTLLFASFIKKLENLYANDRGVEVDPSHYGELFNLKASISTMLHAIEVAGIKDITPHKLSCERGSLLQALLKLDEKTEDLEHTGHDDSKLGLIYWRAHQLAAQAAGKPVQLVLIDDRENILLALYKFAKQFPQLFPINCRLRFLQHSSDSVLDRHNTLPEEQALLERLQAWNYENSAAADIKQLMLWHDGGHRYPRIDLTAPGAGRIDRHCDQTVVMLEKLFFADCCSGNLATNLTHFLSLSENEQNKKLLCVNHTHKMMMLRITHPAQQLLNPGDLFSVAQPPKQCDQKTPSHGLTPHAL